MTVHGRNRQFDWLGTSMYERPSQPEYLPITPETLAGVAPAKTEPVAVKAPEEPPMKTVEKPTEARHCCNKQCGIGLKGNNTSTLCQNCLKTIGLGNAEAYRYQPGKPALSPDFKPLFAGGKRIDESTRRRWPKGARPAASAASKSVLPTPPSPPRAPKSHPAPFDPRSLSLEQLQLCQPELLRRLAEVRARELLAELADRIGAVS